MDPLSIAASVAGLLSLISTIVSQGYTLVYACKGQSKEIETLLREVSSFGGVLLGLQAHIEESKDSPVALLLSNLLDDEKIIHNLVSTTQRKTPLSECKSLLNQVEDLLKKFKKTNPISRALKWQALSGDLAGLVSKIEHYKATFILCFSLESSNQLNKSLDLQKEIVTELSSIRAEQKRIEEETVTQRNLQRQSALLKWLGQTTEAKHKDCLSFRHKDTGTWLLEREEYLNWVSAEGLSLFWLNGISGSGKTILVSNVIDNLQDFYSGDKTKGLAYYYFDFLQDQSLTPTRLIGSLASQLLRQTSGKGIGESQAFQLFDEYQNKSVYPHMKELEELFLALASGFSTTFIILDGIDEYADRSDVLDFVGRLTTLDFDLKIFVASRRSPDLVKDFQHFQSVTIEPMDIEKDVENYIQARLSSLRHQRAFQSVEGINALKQGANGMFLWITCQLDDLARSRTKVKSLSALPRGLGEIYRNILSYVDEDDKLLQRRILRLLLFARRPLDLCEVVEGIAIDTDMLRQAELEQSLLCKSEDIFEICGSLVRRSEMTGKIQLAHHSVREFLTSPSMRNGTPNEFFISENESVEIAKTCLSYLSLEEFNSAQFKGKDDWESMIQLHLKIADMTTDSSFLEYAAVNWWEHLPQSVMETDAVWSAVSRFFDQKRGNFSYWVGVAQYMFDEYKYPSSMTPLHVCAMHGLVPLAQRLLQEGYLPDSVTADLRTPLHIALENRQDSMVDFLIRNGAALCQPSRNGRRPLDLAIESGNEVAVKALLRGGCDANLCLPSGEYPLSIAVENKWDAVIPILLEKTKPDLCLPDGRTIVHLAAEIGSENIMKTLLKESPDLARRDNSGWTVAHFAAHNGHTQVLKLLLSNGAHPRAEDCNGWTPIHAAIHQRHLEASIVLLNPGGHGETQLAPRLSRIGRAGRVGVSGKYTVDSVPFDTSGSASTSTTTDVPSPLYLAVSGSFSDGVELLLKEKKYLVDMVKCLKTAVCLADATIVCLLLSKARGYQIKQVLPEVRADGPEKLYLMFLKAYYDAEPSLETHPVFQAIITKNNGLLQLLLEKGAVKDFYFEEGTPLHYAAMYRNSDAAIYLLEHGADVNAKNAEGKIPLHVIAGGLSPASFDGETRIWVDLLIGFGADMYELDNTGQSALQLGVLSGNVESVNYLLSVGVASVHDSDGNTLLHLAVENGSAPMVELLLKVSNDGALGLRSENAFAVDSFNNRRETPLTQAVAKERLELIPLLLGSGAQVSVRDKSGRTPLHIAALGEHYSDIGPLLIAAGASEDTQDNTGNTPSRLANRKICNDLHKAIINPRPALVLALLEKRANANFQVDGSSLLHAAVNIQSRKIMNHLIDHGADINARDTSGRTLLHIAIVKSYTLVKVLIERGAKYDILDSSGRTAVDLASSVNSPELESLLKEHGIELPNP